MKRITKNDGNLDLVNGRSQMVVSSLYCSELKDGEENMRVFFQDYCKTVGISKLMDYLSNSLDVQAERDEGEGRVDIQVLENIDLMLREHIKKVSPSTRIKKDFSRWKKTCKNT